MSVGIMVLMGLLFFYQVTEFMSFQSTSEIIIDTSEEDQFFTLNLDVTFPETPCSILSLDIVDVTGVHVVNIIGTMEKRVLNPQGKVINTYSAIKTHDRGDQEKVYLETVESLKQQEGCQMVGSVNIHKVPGNFHISSHDFGEAYQKLFYGNY